MFKGNYNRHIESTHNKKSIECTKCKKSYPSYSKHKCFSEEESPKKICTLCGKMVKYLKQHIEQVHNAEDHMIIIRILIF